MRPETRERWIRRKYLIPNAVTVAGMFCGFLSLIYAASDRFEKAALVIFIAIVLDGLDGRVARSLKATSKFGVEFDSFADVISFGAAPAYLMYQWCFRLPADEFGVIVCFLFLLCAASRLARFNIAEPSIMNFEGLPTPGAAAMVAALVNLFPRIENGYFLIGLCTLMMLSLSWLMISRVQFYSVKRIKIAEMHIQHVVALGLGIALVWYHSGIGMLVLAGSYCVSGPVGAALRARKTATQSEAKLEVVRRS